jgi:hypothetical protein
MRATQAEFEQIARRVILFIEQKRAPVQLNEIEETFANENLSISVGRVILQLLADRKLYLTEDRKVMVTSHQMALA